MNCKLRNEKLRLCAGCSENFYNGNNTLGVSECWHLKSARICKRWRLDWWTDPTTKGAFVQVQVLSCYHEPGRYAYSKELPTHAVDPVRLGRKT
jgi:hypothetical protein